MQKLLAYVLAMGCVGTSAILVRRDATPRPRQSVDRNLANDGAFRDGVYLGELARAAHRQMRAPIGRCSTEKDRASFTAGFRQGFLQQYRVGWAVLDQQDFQRRRSLRTHGIRSVIADDLGAAS